MKNSTQFMLACWRFAVRKRITLSFIFAFILVCEDVLLGERPHAVFDFHDVWGFEGTLLVGIGLLIRTWAAGILCKGSVLATTGPYALTRNPLYLGSLVMMFGFCILIGDWDNCLIMTILGVVIYWPKIKREEEFLSQSFGQAWTDYAASTPTLIPRRLVLREAFSDWSWKRWWINREYDAVVGTLAALVGFYLWHSFAV